MKKFEHAYNLGLRQDIDETENVQRRTLKIIPEIKTQSYNQRLKYLDIISFVQRRLRGEQIEVFKYQEWVHITMQCLCKRTAPL